MRLPNSPPANLALETLRALRGSGFTAYLVGGCVRDLLLGRNPKDYDVATDATLDRLLDLFPGAFPVGAHFGVVLVRDAGACVEVATFRSDHTYVDGRRPESVSFESDPRADALRRDFTVNALFLDPDTGTVTDHVGGQEDLRHRLVRTVGEPDQRFAEDHLRMLRAVRFAAALAFEIDAGTLSAIKRCRTSIHRISAERIRDEIIRILTEGHPRRGFELLDETGLLQEIMPEVAAMKGVAQPPQFHPEGDVWTHTLLMLQALRQPTLTLALGVLLHDVGKPPTYRVADRIRFDRHPKVGADMAVAILDRLRFSKQQVSRVEDLVRQHLQFMNVRQMRESTLKRFLRLDGFEEHLELHRLDCLASHGNLENYDFVRDRLESLSIADLKPQPLLTGKDLIASGYTPGPAFKRMLTLVETAQLESKVHTPAQALALVRSRFPISSRQVRPPGPIKPAGT